MKRFFAAFAVASVAVAGCGTSDSSSGSVGTSQEEAGRDTSAVPDASSSSVSVQRELPERDEAVAALIPTGSYTVEGQLMVDGTAAMEFDGYVSFGSKPDGVDCEAEYTSWALVPERVPDVRSVHAGGRSWYQDISDPTTPREWMDGADPRTSDFLPTLRFVPALVTSYITYGAIDGGGTGVLCSIPVMPRFMKVDGQGLRFDDRRVYDVAYAGRERWVDETLTALGYTGDRHRGIAENMLVDVTGDWTSFTQGATVTVSGDSDGIVKVEQRTVGSNVFGESVLMLTFSPVSKRAVVAPDADSYFERLAKDATSGSIPEELKMLSEVYG